MGDFNANLGTVTAQEKIVLAGDGVVRSYPIAPGENDLQAGTVVSLDNAEAVVPFDEAQVIEAGLGDGAAVDFAADLSGCRGLVPGSVSVTDGVETFTDDGFGGLAGDAGGTGRINYLSGAVVVTFNAAPAVDAPVDVSYKPGILGVLERDAAYDSDGFADVIRQGRVNRQELLVGGAAAPVTVLEALDAQFIYPVG